MAQSRHASVIFAIVAGTIGLAAQTPARAAPATVKIVDISGPSPFAPDGCGVDISQLGSEYEPDLAVNPKNQRNIIVIWSQDKQISNVVATSHDGGEHWTQVLVPGLSKCTGGTADSALDARVSFGSDGTAYLSSQVVESKHGHLFWTLLVNRSSDGGLSWSDPVTIDQAGPWPVLALDFPVLVADPRRPGTAYVVWSRFHDLFTAPAAPQFFARTTDAGVTWTPPAMIPITPQPKQTAFASQIRVLSDGTLVNVFIQIPVAVVPIGPTSVWAMRSQDQGDSWSAPIFVADIPENVLTDPDNGRGLGRGDSFVTPSVAVGGNKEVYLVWHLIASTVSSRILFTKSLDGGATWSAPMAVAVEATQAFLPTVAVSPSGAIGVTYFDFRGDAPGDAQLTTDVWFRHSQDGGATWSETHVAGPFDIRLAPSPGAFPLGDYFGLQPIGRDGFGAVFVETISPQTEGVTDVFFAQVQVPPAPQAGDGSGCTLSPSHTDGGRLFALLVVPVLILHWTRRRWCQSAFLPVELRARRLMAALACAVLCGAGAHSTQAGLNVWTSHGPGGGSVRALAIDPTRSGTLYVGTDVGIFKSTDSASNWQAADTGLRNTGLLNTPIRVLTIDPTTPNTLYAAIDGYPGLFKSTDGASSWVITGLGDAYVLALAIDPTTPSTLYAATAGGLFKSTDGAASWQARYTVPFGAYVASVVIDPTTPSTLYAMTAYILCKFGCNGDLIKSTDGASTWVDTGLTTKEGATSFILLTIDATKSTTLYAVTGDGVFRSTDGASSWQAANAGLTGTSVSAIATDPATPTTLYAATGDGVFKSTDGASSWTAINVDLTNYTYVQALAIDPATPSTLYAATPYGLFRSTDGASDWAAVNASLTGTSVSAVAVDPTTPSTLYAGTNYRGVFKSTDGASSWATTSVGLANYTSVYALAIDPTVPGTLYAGTDGGVFKSTDSASNWQAVNAGLTGNGVSGIAINPTTPITLYAWNAGTDGGVSKSTDGGSTWVVTALTNTYVQALAIDPATPGTLYAVTGDGVFKSTDGASSWNAINTGPPHTFVRALAIDPTRSGTLYAGTDAGVFKSTDGAGSWNAINTGLPDTFVFAIAVAPTMPSMLYAGTSGSGVFEIEQVCVGDCHANGSVTIDELVTLVHIALGDGPTSACDIGDVNHDGRITVDEIVTAVNLALTGCL